MTLLAGESATYDVPPPRRTAQEPAATYAYAFGTESKQANEPRLGADWLTRASRLSRMPATRRNLMALLERQIDVLRSVSEDQATLLGEIIGGARGEGLHTLAELYRTSAPPRATWTRSLFSGVLKQWPEALASVAAVAEPLTVERMLGALEVPALHGRQVRSVATRAYGVLAARGDINAIRALEKLVLGAPNEAGERASILRVLCDRAFDAVPKLARDRDVQEAVDVAVGIVDISLKAGHASELNRVLKRLDPDMLPPEVVLAFLATSKPAATALPDRSSLVERFEQALRARGRSDADTLMRFAR